LTKRRLKYAKPRRRRDYCPRGCRLADNRGPTQTRAAVRLGLGLSNVAPAHWNHISLTGDHSWRRNKHVEKGWAAATQSIESLAYFIFPFVKSPHIERLVPGLIRDFQRINAVRRGRRHEPCAHRVTGEVAGKPGRHAPARHDPRDGPAAKPLAGGPTHRRAARSTPAARAPGRCRDSGCPQETEIFVR
jgi:hypothetical protein